MYIAMFWGKRMHGYDLFRRRSLAIIPLLPLRSVCVHLKKKKEAPVIAILIFTMNIT